MDSKYLEGLWFTMHHSDDPERQTLIIRCYLDESGTHEGSPQATVAGLLMNRDDFLMLDALWNDLMLRHKIQPPLHMKEFGEHGRHGHLNYEERFPLFSDISKLINCHKIMSVAATLSHSQYKTIVHPEIQKKMSIYSLCFMLCVHRIHLDVEQKGIPDKIAYFVEQGNEYQHHILKAHDGMIRMQENNMYLHVGSLRFADKNNCALQAADVIAWGARRRVTGIPIGKGYQPISYI